MTTNNPAEALRDLRAQGLMVAVHNDYRLNGEFNTFWLFTTPDGRAIKGEGKTDMEALEQVRAALTSPAPAGGEALGRQFSEALNRYLAESAPPPRMPVLPLEVALSEENDALIAENVRLRETLADINMVASPNHERTFDRAIADLDYIRDHARLHLKEKHEMTDLYASIKKRPVKLVDPKCYELAEHFMADHKGATAEHKRLLSEAIQDAVECYFNGLER